MKNLLVFFTLFLLFILLSTCKQGRLIFDSEIKLDTLILLDANFINDRLFFVDSYYRNNFETGFTDDLQQWFCNPTQKIIKLEVFKTSVYSNFRSVNTIASVHPEKYLNITKDEFNKITIKPGETVLTTTTPLEPEEDYKYDPLRGIILLRRSIRDNEILGVSFSTSERSVGEYYESITDTNQTLSIQLIRDKANQPEYTHIWPLTVRNAYFIPDSIYYNEYFDLKIGFYTENNISFSQVGDPQNTFINLLGLDVIDNMGNVVEGGDGYFDKSPSMRIDDFEVILFPGVNPFNPEPESKFQLSKNNIADIYNSENSQIRYGNSRFKIFCFYK